MMSTVGCIAGAKISLLLLFIFAATTVIVNGYTPSSSKPPFIQRNDLIGIWKLTHSHLIDEDDESKQQQQQQSKDNQSSDNDEAIIEDGIDQSIVLRLNEDGTFDPYTREPRPGDPPMHQILGRSGTWEYNHEQSLILATNRPGENDSNVINNNNDTVFCGKLLVHTTQALEEENGSGRIIDHDGDNNNGDDDEDDSKSKIALDVQLSVPKGQILCGKYMYPKTHKAFFDEPMLFRQSCVGSFAISQLLGNLNTRLQNEEKQRQQQNAKEMQQSAMTAKFHKHDFYGRKFLLVSSPHKVNPTYAAKDKHYNEDTANIDIRTISIEFHSNNTFTAVGVEKILRGRYGITGSKRDKLWFQVSLFGAGRSAPGSVYSEGRLLNHDDRRGYIGKIQTITRNSTGTVNNTNDDDNDNDDDYIGNNNETIATSQFFIDGEIYFGTDIKTPKKPNSMGLFSMQEILNDTDDEEIDDEIDDDDDNDDFSSRSAITDYDDFETTFDDDDAFQ